MKLNINEAQNARPAILQLRTRLMSSKKYIAVDIRKDIFVSNTYRDDVYIHFFQYI